MDTRLQKIGRSMSYFLRHSLSSFKIVRDGYVFIDELLTMEQFKLATYEDIQKVCDSDNKNRFNIISVNGRQMIRANQGHSNCSIEEEKIFEKIVTPRDYCVHGTDDTKIKSILSSGLNRCSRTHIHFASSPDAISGYRQSSTVLIHIDMKLAMEDGIEFWMSSNGVILSTGINGIIDKKYFNKIETVKNGLLA